MTATPVYTFAYQPIVDVAARRIVSHEALIRGRGGEGAASVLDGLSPLERHALDRESRRTAISMAAQLGLDASLNLNVTPRGLVTGDTLATIMDSVAAAGLRPAQIVLEVTEGESIADADAFAAAVTELRHAGLTIAIDDFGAGYSGLNLLADFQPDCIKLDMSLVRSIESRGPRQAIVRALLTACSDLGIDVIAEGVETAGECEWFRDEGVTLFQGYWFARPAFERLAAVDLATIEGLARRG